VANFANHHSYWELLIQVANSNIHWYFYFQWSKIDCANHLEFQVPKSPPVLTIRSCS